MTKAVLVVESPHMIKTATDALSGHPAFDGWQWKGAATFGHLMDLRKEPFDLEWSPVNPAILEGFVERIAEADQIVVATDPDDEGERIAFQVRSIAQMVNPEARVNRIRTHAWVPDVLNEVLGNPSKLVFHPEAAFSAERRRAFDRMVGMVFGAPGRIKGAFLRAWQEQPPPTHYSDERVIVRPPGCASLLMQATRHGLSVKEAYDQLCDAWAKGQVSYPRTDGTLYDPSLAALAVRIAQQRGIRNATGQDLIGENGSHTALVPTRVRAGRNESGILEILRDLTASAVSGKPIRPPSSGQAMPEDARWLSVAQRQQLGRPSTLSSHIQSLSGETLPGQQGLTPAASEKLNRTPEGLTGSHQAEIEQAMSNPGIRLSDFFERLGAKPAPGELKSSSWQAAAQSVSEMMPGISRTEMAQRLKRSDLNFTV
ncbi:MAG: type IA DNA topoisomerase [Marinospirillum sp.]|uniref:toprim domain-containing protein n=1 Tax=Marinospirillum sp. TaxID=2183934 RepID=UPI001A0A2BF0|nr:toprim domain-containing protein [Marinospirillum sp.]MBE0506068.1 type IA DNA topoisomerase [Marinospirillum sp.]